MNVQELRSKIDQHLRQLSSHVRDRQTAQLLEQAAIALKELTNPLHTEGSALIAQERQRQIEQEKFDPPRDDQYKSLELLRASDAYISWNRFVGTGEPFKKSDCDWPWDDQTFKPTTPLRNLVKAGALIAAEIDRLQRLEKKV